MNIPAQYNQLMPYLIIKNTNGFRQFMKTAFDAVEQLTVPGPNDVVMHGELRIGQAVIMYAEASDQFPVMNAGMYLHVDNCDARFAKALTAGATVITGQEPADKAYGRACGVQDEFGNVWWLTEVKSLVDGQ
jgi:PhnB protein